MNYFRSLKNSVNIPFVTAAVDADIKIYKVTPHATFHDQIAVATSIGMVVLTISKQSLIGPYTGSHPTWNGSILSMNGSSILKQNLRFGHGSDRLNQSNALDDGDDIDDDASDTSSQPTPRPGLSNSQAHTLRSTPGGRTKSTSSLPGFSTSDIKTRRTRISIDIVDTCNVNESNSGLPDGISNPALNAIKDSKFRLFGSSKSTAVAKGSSKVGAPALSSTEGLPEGVLATVTPSGRPIFLPSPSGDYCAVVWQEASAYVIMKVKTTSGGVSVTSESVKGASSGNVDSMEVIERGACLSFSWIHTAVFSRATSTPGSTQNTPILQNEIFAVLLPGKRSLTVVKTKGLLSTSEVEELGSFQSPKLLYKQILVTSASAVASQLSVEVKAIEVSSPAGVSIVNPHCICGGLLLCVTSERQNTSQARAAPTGSSARSASTPAAQGLSAVTTALQAKSASSTDKTPQVKLSSSVTAAINSTLQQVATYTEENTGNRSKFNEPILKSQFYTLVPVSGTASSTHFRLESVGAAMPPATTVHWDFETGYGAVLCGSRISIIKLSASQTSDNQAQLRSITTVDLSDSYSALPTSQHWKRGCLFVTTPTQLSLIATDYPFCVSQKSAVTDTNRDNLSVSESSVEVFTISSQSQVIQLFLSFIYVSYSYLPK